MHITCSKKKIPYLESISYRVQKLHSYSDMELRLIAFNVLQNWGGEDKMDNNFKEDEVVLQYILILFWSLSSF